MNNAIQKFYSSPSEITQVGTYKTLVDELPENIEAIVKAVQGLIIYDMVAEDFYDHAIPSDRASEIHIRPVEKIINEIISRDSSKLSEERSLGNRVVGRCPHYARLLVAILRDKGIPACARCGFARYFNPGSFEDHSVCEYWKADENRWVFVDAQMDEVWQEKLHIDFNIFDVPRDKFIVAADAWSSCRSGDQDPKKFGITFEKMHGLWFIAVSLVHDLAVLNKKEVLQWDTWGAQPKKDEKLNEEQLSFFDSIADLTHDADEFHDEVIEMYNDQRLKVPATVFNALLNREETVEV